MSLETIVAIAVIVGPLGYMVWANRHDPEFWSPEAVRQRRRILFRSWNFWASLATWLIVIFVFRVDPLWAGCAMAVVAVGVYFLGQAWRRAVRYVKWEDQAPNAPPESN